MVEEKFLRFLSSLQLFFFENFATNFAEVRNGHFWTILNKFRVLLIFKGLNEKFFKHNLNVNVPLNFLEPLKYLVFKIFQIAHKIATFVH